MSLHIAGITTERSQTLDSNRSLLTNFSSDNDTTAFLDQHEDEDSMIVDQDELLFYFALYKVSYHKF